jgi:hypothetical protein
MEQALGTQSEAGLRAWAATGRSAASWPAILAGAFVAVSTSLILIVLGSGLGFAAVSPWAGHGASATGLTISSAIWLIVTQWISAALGGYVAGRLRTKWTGTHTHEVFFRDTAHGLVTWSVATVFVAWVIAGIGMHAVAGAASGAAAPAAAGAASESPAPAAMAYDIDRLFRASGSSHAAGDDSDGRAETLYIAYHAIAVGNMSDADRGYLAALVAAQTGISASEAQRRVGEFADATLSAANRAKEGADAARKAAAQAAIYTALSLLIGAFIASVSGAIGGRLRDEHP